MKEKLWIIGAGGHAKVVADIALATDQFEIMGFVDQQESKQKLFDKKIFSEDQFQWPENDFYFIGVGFNFLRSKIAEKHSNKIKNIKWATLIHPSAIIGRSGEIKEGTAIMAGAVVNPFSTIGTHCVINTASVVEHECVFESGSGLGPGAVVGGNVTVGVNSYLGIGCTVLHSIKIGNDAVVGAGAVVTKNVESCSVVAGVPAKFIRNRKLNENYLSSSSNNKS